jgi:hypothetical protein
MHLVAAAPPIFVYLAFTFGSLIIITDDVRAVVCPGQSIPQVDEHPPFMGLQEA